MAALFFMASILSELVEVTSNIRIVIARDPIPIGRPKQSHFQPQSRGLLHCVPACRQARRNDGALFEIASS